MLCFKLFIVEHVYILLFFAMYLDIVIYSLCVCSENICVYIYIRVSVHDSFVPVSLVSLFDMPLISTCSILFYRI